MSKNSNKLNENLKKNNKVSINEQNTTDEQVGEQIENEKIKVSKRKKLDFEGNTKREGEGSMYDKILRENLLDIFLPLVEEELNVKIKSISTFPDKQPTTVIRETDSFLLVKTYSKVEPEFILHIEFESGDDEEMIYRVSEHHGIELRKQKLPIKHIVIYLGTSKPKMRTKLKEEEIFKGFTLVNAYNFSPSKWLEEDEPSKIIMAILSDYQKENAVVILEAIMNKLRRVCKSATDLKKFIEQLIIISRMRNLEELTIKISKAMPITIDIKKDYLYNLGLQKREAEVKEAKAEAERLTKEKANLEAEAERLTKEKANLEAKAKAEAERLVNLEAEAEKARMDKKIAIQKMQATGRFSNEEIIEYLNLDAKTFLTFLKEI